MQIDAQSAARAAHSPPVQRSCSPNDGGTTKLHPSLVDHTPHTATGRRDRPRHRDCPRTDFRHCGMDQPFVLAADHGKIHALRLSGAVYRPPAPDDYHRGVDPIPIPSAASTMAAPPSPTATLPPTHAGSGVGDAAAHGAKKRFLSDAREYVRDTDHRAFLRRALAGYYATRDGQKARYRDWEQARDAANLAKWNAVNRLDEMLVRFADAFEAGGGKVHWARDAEEARGIILGIVRDSGARAII